MSAPPRAHLEAAYREALAAYVRAPDEHGLTAAYDLGHRAVEAEIGLLELVTIHRLAVVGSLAAEPNHDAVVASMDFLTESLTTFEMAQRGYEEAKERAALAHEVAVTLQRSLLPAKLPVLDGLDVVVRYYPAGADAEVGGDWYDIVPLDDRRVGLVVGDITGHGIPQAAVMGQIRLGVRAYMVEGHPLDEVVHRSDALLQSLTDMFFATLVVVVVDLDQQTLTVANAGHPPPALLTPTGDASALDGEHGHLLGIRRARHQPVTGPLPLRPGTSLLLYTDGLIDEAERAGDDGLLLLQNTIAGFHGTAEALCALIEGSMLPDAPRDDVCLLAATLMPTA